MKKMGWMGLGVLVFGMASQAFAEVAPKPSELPLQITCASFSRTEVVHLHVGIDNPEGVVAYSYSKTVFKGETTEFEGVTTSKWDPFHFLRSGFAVDAVGFNFSTVNVPKVPGQYEVLILSIGGQMLGAESAPFLCDVIEGEL